jgi:hypothetical protein
MMTKEQFIKRMSLIQNFHSQQNTVSKLITAISDGFAVVDIGDYLVSEILDIIIEDLQIKDKDLLGWWLYDTNDKVIYYKDNDKEISVRTLEELYDYLISDKDLEDNENKEEYITDPQKVEQRQKELTKEFDDIMQTLKKNNKLLD